MHPCTVHHPCHPQCSRMPKYKIQTYVVRFLNFDVPTDYVLSKTRWCCLPFLMFNNYELLHVSGLAAIFPSTCLSCILGPGISSASPKFLLREGYLPCVLRCINILVWQDSYLAFLNWHILCLVSEIRVSRYVPLWVPVSRGVQCFVVSHYVSQCLEWCPTMCPRTREFSDVRRGLDKQQAGQATSYRGQASSHQLAIYISYILFHCRAKLKRNMYVQMQPVWLPR